MAKLILTKAEEGARTWSELDDATLGKVVKKGIFNLKRLVDEEHGLFLYKAAVILCSIAYETNADTLTTTVNGLKRKDESMGDWKVTIKRIKEVV